MDWYNTWLIAYSDIRRQLKRKSFWLMLSLPLLMPLLGVPFIFLLKSASSLKVQIVCTPQHIETAKVLKRSLERTSSQENGPADTSYPVELFELEVDEIAVMRPNLKKHFSENQLLGYLEVIPGEQVAQPKVALFIEPLDPATTNLVDRVETAWELISGVEDPASIKASNSHVDIRFAATASSETESLFENFVELYGRVAVILCIVVLSFCAHMLVAKPLLMALTKERESLHMLLATFSLSDWIVGKFLGVIIVGGGIFTWYLCLLLVPAVALGAASPLMILWFMLFGLAGFMFHGSINFAIGSMSKDPQDAQRFSIPFILFDYLCIGAVFIAIQAPETNFATGLSFFPFTAMYVGPVQAAFADAMPVWLTISSLLCFWGFVLLGLRFCIRITSLEGLLSDGKAAKQEPQGDKPKDLLERRIRVVLERLRSEEV